MSLGHLIVGEKETYPNRGEEVTDGAKNSLGWYYTREIPRDVQGINGRIQRGENAVLSFRSLGFGCHCRNARWFGGSDARYRFWESTQFLMGTSGNLVIVCLVCVCVLFYYTPFNQRSEESCI